MQSFPFPSRTELLGCYSDQDFLAKLHCVRQAFQVRMNGLGLAFLVVPALPRHVSGSVFSCIQAGTKSLPL